RQLRLHEINQACTLIRNAANNDDVEINFGVVLDPNLEDEVKVTVIATGFQRESLPVIHRRAATTAMPEPRMADAEPVHEPVPEPMIMEAEEAPAAEEPPHSIAAAAHASQRGDVFDDLDVPAILRRSRKFLQ